MTAAVTATLLLELARPSAQTPSVNLTGTWTGTASDRWVNRGVTDAMTVTWILTQTGSAVSGTAVSNPLNPNDGSCSSCHRGKSGTVSGTVSGNALSLTMHFPGTAGEITPACSATFTGTAATLATTAFTFLYTGNDSCEGPFSEGSLGVTRAPATPPTIASQPVSRRVPVGQPATLTVTGAGTAPLTFQWFRGLTGVVSDPIAGAVAGAYTEPAVAVAASYWVRIANAYGQTIDSETARLTPYVPFTDDTLTVGVSVVRGQHVVELRARINAIRARFGLRPFDFADATLAPGASGIRAQHLAELRTALAEAYAAAGRTAPSYTDPALAAGHVVKRLHVAEIRDAVADIE